MFEEMFNVIRKKQGRCVRVGPSRFPVLEKSEVEYAIYGGTPSTWVIARDNSFLRK